MLREILNQHAHPGYPLVLYLMRHLKGKMIHHVVLTPRRCSRGVSTFPATHDIICIGLCISCLCLCTRVESGMLYKGLLNDFHLNIFAKGKFNVTLDAQIIWTAALGEKLYVCSSDVPRKCGPTLISLKKRPKGKHQATDHAAGSKKVKSDGHVCPTLSTTNEMRCFQNSIPEGSKIVKLWS